MVIFASSLLEERSPEKRRSWRKYATQSKIPRSSIHLAKRWGELTTFGRDEFIHLMLMQSIAARYRHSAGVVGGTNHNPTQVYPCLLFHSVDCTISTTGSYSRAIPNSFFTILADSNLDLWAKLRQWTLSSRNELEIQICLHSCMWYGAVLTIWFSDKLTKFTIGTVSLLMPTGLYVTRTETSLANTAAGRVSGLIFFLHINSLRFYVPYWSTCDCNLH